MNNEFTIELITPNDNLALKKVIRTALEEYGDDVHNSTYDDPVLNDLASFYEKTPKSKYYVVKKDHQVLGGGGLAPYQVNGVAEVQKLFLSPTTRGHGIGKKLLIMIENEAKKLGYHQLYIETFSNLHAAIGLYQHLDFHKISQPLAPMSHSACDVLMVKDI